MVHPSLMLHLLGVQDENTRLQRKSFAATNGCVSFRKGGSLALFNSNLGEFEPVIDASLN